MKAVVNVLLLVALVAVGLAVLDGLGIADKWAAERAVAEAERAEALAALRQAEGDAPLKQAAARAVGSLLGSARRAYPQAALNSGKACTGAEQPSMPRPICAAGRLHISAMACKMACCTG